MTCIVKILFMGFSLFPFSYYNRRKGRGNLTGDFRGCQCSDSPFFNSIMTWEMSWKPVSRCLEAASELASSTLA